MPMSSKRIIRRAHISLICKMNTLSLFRAAVHRMHLIFKLSVCAWCSLRNDVCFRCTCWSIMNLIVKIGIGYRIFLLVLKRRTIFHQNTDRLSLEGNFCWSFDLRIISTTNKTRVSLANRHISMSQIYVNQLHRNKMFWCTDRRVHTVAMHLCAGDQYMRAICFNAINLARTIGDKQT